MHVFPSGLSSSPLIQSYILSLSRVHTAFASVVSEITFTSSKAEFCFTAWVLQCSLLPFTMRGSVYLTENISNSQ